MYLIRGVEDSRRQIDYKNISEKVNTVAPLLLISLLLINLFFKFGL